MDSDQNNWNRYSNTCTVLNVATILLMAAITAVILILIGIDITISVIVAIVPIFPFAWVEEHFLSRGINALVGRVLKYRHEYPHVDVTRTTKLLMIYDR